MQDLIKISKDFGAYDAKIINPSEVVTASWTLNKCKYGCKNYNKRQCCPPIATTGEQMNKMLESYKKVLLIQSLMPEDVNLTLSKVLHYLSENGYYKALGFGAKKCEICRDDYDMDCSFPDCKHADKVIPQMDGSGCDVMQTAKNAGFDEDKIKKWTDDQLKFYGLILID